MRKALLVLVAFFCAACSNYSANLPSIKPYKMDIQQGNVVTSKMMMQLRPGMSKSQVRFVMGTPLIADSFHADRWDYLYRMVKGGKVIEQRHVILDFENDQLKRVRGDVIPAGSGDAAAEPAPASKTEARSVPAPKAKEKGLIDKLKFWKSDEAPAKTETQSAPAEQGPVKAPATLSGEQPAKAAPAPEAKPEPALPAAEPKREAAPVEAKPAEPVKAAEPPAQPAPVKRPAAQPKPAPAPEPVKAEPAKVEAAQPEPRKTIPADELPPEDDPGYFERMLEKIGF